MSKLVESFKSPDFDTDYFVAEAVKSDRVNLVVTQLNQALESAETELRSVVKTSSDLILSAANTADIAIGDLLSLREHIGPLNDALEKINRNEQDNLARIKEAHADLRRAMEVAAFVKKVARVSGEVSKLRAQFPDLSKDTPDRQILQSIATAEDLAALRKVDIIKDDIKWLDTAHEMTGRVSQASPAKPRS